MAKKQTSAATPADNALKNVSYYRFPEATRKNNPPAKIAAEGYVPLIPKAEYLYSPRRPPELRFDPTGARNDQDGKIYLARVVVDEEDEPPAIVTAYRTSKIEKYWSAE